MKPAAEKMYSYQIGYRVDRQSVVGILGIGFSDREAQDHALMQIYQRFGAYDVKRVIVSPTGLNHTQIGQLQRDWEQCRRQFCLTRAVVG